MNFKVENCTLVPRACTLVQCDLYDGEGCNLEVIRTFFDNGEGTIGDLEVLISETAALTLCRRFSRNLRGTVMQSVKCFAGLRERSRPSHENSMLREAGGGA
jgi:hypothetical protein